MHHAEFLGVVTNYEVLQTKFCFPNFSDCYLSPRSQKLHADFALKQCRCILHRQVPYFTKFLMFSRPIKMQISESHIKRRQCREQLTSWQGSTDLGNYRHNKVFIPSLIAVSWFRIYLDRRVDTWFPSV
jgi:hypothetical protein